VAMVVSNPLNPPAELFSPLHEFCAAIDEDAVKIEEAAMLASQRTAIDQPAKALSHWWTSRDALTMLDEHKQTLEEVKAKTADGYTVTTSPHSWGFKLADDTHQVAQLDPSLREVFKAPPDDEAGLSVMERARAEAWFRGMKSYSGLKRPPKERTISVQELEKMENCRVQGIHAFKGDGDGKGNYGEFGEYWKVVGEGAQYDGQTSRDQFVAFINHLKKNRPEIYEHINTACAAHTEVEWKPVKLTIDKLYCSDRAVWLLCKILKVQLEIAPLKNTSLKAVRASSPSMVDMATGMNLSETKAMLTYIASMYGAAADWGLYPSTDQKSAGKKKALIDQLLFLDETKLIPAVAAWVAPQVDRGAPEKMTARKAVEEALDYLEELLAKQGQSFLTGPAVCVADLSLVCSLSTLELVEDTVEKWPNVKSWSDATKAALDAMDGGAGHWKDTHGYYEGVKGARFASLASSRITSLCAHPSLAAIQMDMARIERELPASLLGRWSALESFDVAAGQLTLKDLPELRFERIIVGHPKKVGKVLMPGDSPGGAGRLVTAEVGVWALEMPNEAVTKRRTPTLVLQVRRRVARREGVAWDKCLEADECSEAGGPALKVVRIPLDDAANGTWSIEGFNPTLSATAYEDLDSVYEAVDSDGDGMLTPEELTSVLGNNEFVKSIDRSGDGLVTKDEYLQFARDVLKERGSKALKGFVKNCTKKVPKAAMRKVVLSKQSRAIFKALDRDCSGTIDRDEIREFDKRGKFFNRLDKDGSGGVSCDEFVAYILSMHTDRNAKAVEGFLKHVRSHCEGRLPPSGDDLMASMTAISRPDFVEHYKHAFQAS